MGSDEDCFRDYKTLSSVQLDQLILGSAIPVGVGMFTPAGFGAD